METRCHSSSKFSRPQNADKGFFVRMEEKLVLATLA